MEKWKEIPGFKDYKISNKGIVFSLISDRNLKGYKDTNGYIRVTLIKNNKKYRFTVHRLVFISFKGIIPDHLQIGHLDGTRDNNNLSNLALVTIKENAEHRKIHGTEKFGEFHPNSKLSEKDVIWIRSNYKNISMREMARKFKVSRTAIKYVIIRKNWAWLK